MTKIGPYQGHQAALVGCTGRPTWTYSNGDLSMCVHDVYRVTTCRPGRGHIVAAARPPTACYLYTVSKLLWSGCQYRRKWL